MTDRVTIYDTTLREACQGSGISLSLHDKLAIMRMLDKLGVDYVEGGWPGTTPNDAEFFVAAREEGLRHARLTAFGSTRHADVRAEKDAGLRLLLDAGTETVALVGMAWDFHVDAGLRTTLEENLAMVSDSVAHLKANGREVVFDAEHFFDGYRASRDYALAVLHAAAAAGADWLVLCDTNGGSLPDQIGEGVAEAVGAFGSRVGIHAHDDGELAVANSLAAVSAGARHVQGTVSRYGEGAGNANLCSIVPNLVLKLGFECAAGEHLDPSAVDNLRHIVVGEQSGRGFEDGEASVELLARRATGDYQPPFEARAYAVDSRKGRDDEGSSSTASAEVGVGHEVLRGEATGLGPVNALERAFRRALTPAYPHLARVSLTDFRATIARSSEGAPGRVQVRLTGVAPGAEPWTTVGSSSDLLHSSWLALCDCLEYAILTRAGIAPGHPELLPDAGIPVAELAAVLRPELGPEELGVLERVAATDWTQTRLDLADADDRAVATQAAALGVAVFYNFGNFCAIAAHPHRESVKRVNLVKGRPENQVGSLTSTRTRLGRLFDWSLLPAELDRGTVLALMDDFFELGPMGFRGPAAHDVPGHLTSLDQELRTTQVIGPGYRCPSNELLDEILTLLEEDFLFITSANVSGGVTGKVEAAHYDLRGMQDDFGGKDGILLIGHRDEAAARASYRHHLPMSTSILAFHKLGRNDVGESALVLERRGSLDVDVVERLVRRSGFGLVLGEKAHERLPLRDDFAAEA